MLNYSNIGIVLLEYSIIGIYLHRKTFEKDIKMTVTSKSRNYISFIGKSSDSPFNIQLKHRKTQLLFGRKSGFVTVTGIKDI